MEARRDLSISYHKLGNIAEARGDLDGAQAYYRKELEIAMALAEETRTVASVDDLAVAHFRLALVCPGEAVAHLQEAARLWDLLCDACPEVAEYRRRAQLAQKMLDRLGSTGK